MDGSDPRHQGAKNKPGEVVLRRSGGLDAHSRNAFFYEGPRPACIHLHADQ